MHLLFIWRKKNVVQKVCNVYVCVMHIYLYKVFVIKFSA
jgi:hypothetical protein